MSAIQQAFDAQLKKSRSSVELLTAELKAKENAALAAKLEADNDLKIATMVLSAVGKIPIPENGKVGSQGEQGERGDPGVPGAKGIKGDTGPQGKQGLIGLTGKQGPKGDKGDQGKQGEKGIDGTLGAKGEQGPNGDTGEAGKDGLNGRDGTNGKDGIDGKAGPKGDRGEAGRDGKDGLDGKHGVAGKEGAQGKKGPKGDQGPRGLAGKQGVKGKEGSKGKSGEDGIGITDISAYGNDLHIKLTNGTTRQVHMPVRSAPSGGVSPAMPAADFQRAARVPISATGIISTNVEDAIVELKEQIVQSSAGNPFDPGTSEAFMFTYNPYDETHDGKFVYNDTTNQLISKTIETAANVILYTVDFSYNGKQLESKLISDEINNDSVRVDFTYDIKGRLIDKVHTYVV